jgi:hypothetical protein
MSSVNINPMLGPSGAYDGAHFSAGSNPGSGQGNGVAVTANGGGFAASARPKMPPEKGSLDPFFSKDSQPYANKETQRIGGDGTTVSVPFGQRVKESAYRIREQLQTALNTLDKPLSEGMKENLSFYAPREFFDDPKNIQALRQNIAETLSKLDDFLEKGGSIHLLDKGVGPFKGSHETSWGFADPTQINKGVTLNASRMGEPLTDAEFDRRFTHELIHAGAGTNDTYYTKMTLGADPAQAAKNGFKSKGEDNTPIFWAGGKDRPEIYSSNPDTVSSLVLTLNQVHPDQTGFF